MADKPYSNLTRHFLDVSNDVWNLQFVLRTIRVFSAMEWYQMVLKYWANHTITSWNILKEFCMIGVDFSYGYAIYTPWYMK